MCGFLAEISTSLISDAEFKDLLNLSKNRGPDQQLIWENKHNIRIGFNRLSILDVSDKGRQPIISPSGRFILTLNGEIYNYKLLQSKFNLSDYVLRSGSDAEVIAHLLEILPLTDLLSMLEGMFALSVLDKQNNIITIARDYAGIKPLYYGLFDNTFVFASQFNQVFRYPIFSKKLKLRPEIVKEYMGLGYMQAPNTVFENIYQINPGEYLIFDILDKCIKDVKKFFFWNENPKIEETDYSLSNNFNQMFGKVVEFHLQSDVPIASFLSGGIDSPLVSAHAQKFKNDIKAFTLKVDDPGFNESEVASKYASNIGINQEFLYLNENSLVESVNAHFKGIPEPHGDYSSIPTWAICRNARKQATVMLSGDGGDELFWGYPRFKHSIAYLFLFKFPLWLRKMILPFIRQFNKKLSWGPQMFKTFGEWTLHKHINLNNLDRIIPNTEFSKELRDIYAFNDNNKGRALLYLKRNEFYAHMQRVLRKVDLMSMSNSLEVRVPFLSKEVIEFSNLIIPNLGVKHHNPKIVLKKALENFIRPDLIEQHKRGFSVPIHQWMHGPLREEIEYILLKLPLYGSDIFNITYTHSVINDFLEGKQINAWGIWHIYAWQKWALENELI